MIEIKKKKFVLQFRLTFVRTFLIELLATHCPIQLLPGKNIWILIV